ncbi:MAG: sigma-54 dependent transcriptional regulator [Pseudomonadales bacterium]|nr:sigma-54 dependent transcriptional regulator [Pseudomonadales bacterium]NRA18032.1 sigma-54-dependent Fis family transcriptional regulator [Oceanospirillaceae bacterium]
MAYKILLVEDDPDLREALVDTLELAEVSVTCAVDGESAIVKLTASSFDLVVTDVNMPGIDGHQLLSYIKKHHLALPVILMTAYGQIDKAVEAMRHGAVDYLMKPFEPDVLIAAVKKYTQGSDLGNQEAIACATSSQQLLQLARRVAVTDSTVLITGESGTGKEVLARYIHANSPRANKAFVAINCAAIPENMLESILFGHEKGAFTGAVSASAGKFEQANGGTLLLDEITEMSMGLQAKLLRVLQEQEVERVGGKTVIPLDVRVLATTNRALFEFVEEKKFREDLYYRLNVFPLEWLPLRARVEDIIPLAQQILAKYVKKMGRAGTCFSAQAQQALIAHQWPGNVRELDNVIQRALIIQQGAQILLEDLHLLSGPIGMSTSLQQQLEVKLPPLNLDAAPQTQPDEHEDSGNLGSDLRQHEYQIIVDVLKATNGSRKEAALRLDISPRTLRYKLAKIREAGIDLDSLLKRKSS